MRITGVAVGLAAVLVLMSGCGTHEVDRTAWEQDLRAAGVDTSEVNWADLEAVYAEDLCGDSAEQLESFVAVSMDEGTDLGAIRLGFKHVCPDSSDELEDAIDEVQGASAAVDEACATAPQDRTESQSRLAEAMAC